MVDNNTKNESISFLFKIISECNDICPFCLEHESIKLQRPRLTFTEFKKNYKFLRKKYHPNYMIISGGEPTLHPDFFKMIDYLKDKKEGFRIITNLITSSDLEFAKKIKNSFQNFDNDRQKERSKVIVSINDESLKSATAKKRYGGLKNLLKLGVPLVIVITIYKDNLEHLPKVSQKIRKIIEENSSGKTFYIEFRMIYHSKTINSLVKKSLPNKSLDVKKSLEKCLEVFNISQIKVTVWNFPLCYLKNYKRVENSGVLERKNRKIIRVNVDEQCERHVTENWFDFFKKDSKCQNCRMNGFCTGVDDGYVEENYYPLIKAIV